MWAAGHMGMWGGGKPVLKNTNSPQINNSFKGNSNLQKISSSSPAVLDVPGSIMKQNNNNN